MFVMHKENTIIRMFRVSKRYGKMEALHDLTVDIRNNEFVFVTGPSGAGKSTMIKLLYMGETVSEGSIIIDGMNMDRITQRQIPMLRRKLGVIFQDFKLIPTKTVFQNVALVLEIVGVRPKDIQGRVTEALIRVGIDDRAGELPPVLSGGEKQRVAVARAIVGEPKIILADEPTGSLDPDSASHIFQLLRDAHESGTTVIVATHDQQMINTGHGRVVRLAKGRLNPEDETRSIAQEMDS
ncbi:MAG: cell division ATP-binding protein FtsE [Desulfobacteraceae bacterium]|nr:cell division ATP-binding protein FtsE [Desulfobacteraceae bacterium]